MFLYFREMDMYMRSERKKKKSKTWLKVMGILLLLLLISGGAYTYSVYHSLTNAVSTMQQPIERVKSEKRPEVIALAKQEPFSVLMLGVDERTGDKGRSDTMIVLTVNPNNNSVKMLSIPRDTRTEIVGRGKVDKINHAYAFGGEEMSMATVENLLDIPIDYYIKINMEGFKDVVDAVGGVTVNNELDFSEDGHHFAKGTLNLNGDEALAFVRMRYNDPNGDFGRQKRQREVIQGVMSKGASFSSLTRFGNIFAALGKNVRTNITFDEMKDIQSNYKDAVQNIEQIQMTGKGTKINGIFYETIPEEEIQSVQKELKTQLEIQ